MRARPENMALLEGPDRTASAKGQEEVVLYAEQGLKAATRPLPEHFPHTSPCSPSADSCFSADHKPLATPGLGGDSASKLRTCGEWPGISGTSFQKPLVSFRTCCLGLPGGGRDTENAGSQINRAGFRPHSQKVTQGYSHPAQLEVNHWGSTLGLPACVAVFPQVYPGPKTVKKFTILP
jgi:hypothetical protein